MSAVSQAGRVRDMIATESPSLMPRCLRPIATSVIQRQVSV